MYQELIDKCRKAYKDKKIAVAYHYWEEIHELLSKKLDECGEDQNKRWKVYAEYHDSINQIPNQEVYDITDYGKEQAYSQMFRERYPRVNLSKMSGGENLEVLENFCDFYDWLPIKTENGFNIADLQTEQLIAEEDYQTFSELVNRIVGRAIDYFRDEQEWENDDDAINYGLKLYNIAKRYSNGTKWEESWLEDFKNELENF